MIEHIPIEVALRVADVVGQGFYIKPTGSRCIEGAYNSDSDWDFVVYDPGREFYKYLKSFPKAYAEGGSGNQGEFQSFKSKVESDVTNFILVDDKDTFNKWVAAAELAKAMKATDKESRIKIFDTVFGKKDHGGIPF